MKYNVYLNVSIEPDGEHAMRSDRLGFYRNFALEGDSFSAIAHKIDKLQALVETALADEEV